jgi:acetoin utilization deacetylase AcuC-like enzyme
MDPAPPAPRPVAVYYDPVVLAHDTGPHHPENAGRVAACARALVREGVPLECPESPERTLDAVGLVHELGYVARFSAACASAPEPGGRAFALFDSPDNPISSGSFEAAMRAVALVLSASDAVLEGRAKTGFVAARPPGHHALAANAMGFCFFNTIAVAARDLVERGGLARVLVADFDVHHGNGTQEIFWEDGRVAYLSVHRYPFYPGTGAADEQGTGRGRGTTVNVPLPGGTSDADYTAGFVNALEDLASRFRPEFVLVSAGFDAHERDPLGGMRVTEEGFSRMTSALRQVASVYAGGRIVSLLEGGYDPVALADSALKHVRDLSGSD